MSIRAILTPEDLAERTNLLGWYPAKITSVIQEVTKGSDAKPSDGSLNAIVTFSVKNPEKPEDKPRDLKRWFNEKYLGFGRNLWYVGGLLVKGSKTPQELTFEMIKTLEGKEMLVYIKKNKEGYDSVEDWRPLPSV